MRVALTGASGLAGYPIAQALSAAGHDIVTLGRRPISPPLPHRHWSLGEAPDLSRIDAVVHAAFSHVPGKYRGGEGDDPERFLAFNREGSLRLVEEAGSRPVVFLSSRAVYGDYPPGTRLSENMRLRPDTIYGRMKAEVEQAVSTWGGVSLRATGLYGPPPPGRQHKWHDLFAAFGAGETISSRAGTELHGDDLAQAIRTLLEDWPPPADIFNVSDILLDRRDLLSAYGRLSGVRGHLPPRSDAGQVSEMETRRLRRLGWRPRGFAGLERVLREMIEGR